MSSKRQKHKELRVTLPPHDIELLRQLAEQDMRTPGLYIAAMVRKAALENGLDTDVPTKDYGIHGGK